MTTLMTAVLIISMLVIIYRLGRWHEIYVDATSCTFLRVLLSLGIYLVRVATKRIPLSSVLILSDSIE